MKKINVFCASALLSMSMISGGVQAATVDMASLFAGGSIDAGNMRFDNWVVNDVAANTFGGIANLPDFSLMTVSSLDDGGMNPGPGLDFQSNGQLFVAGDGILSIIELDFSFRASVLEPEFLIKDNSLAITAALFDGLDPFFSDAGAGITEEILAIDNSLLATEVVEDGLSPTFGTEDSAEFAPQESVLVSKRITVWAADFFDSAELVSFEQRFSQTRNDVPEPSSLVLIMLGLMGGATRLMRRR